MPPGEGRSLHRGLETLGRWRSDTGKPLSARGRRDKNDLKSIHVRNRSKEIDVFSGSRTICVDDLGNIVDLSKEIASTVKPSDGTIVQRGNLKLLGSPGLDVLSSYSSSKGSKAASKTGSRPKTPKTPTTKHAPNSSGASSSTVDSKTLNDYRNEYRDSGAGWRDNLESDVTTKSDIWIQGVKCDPESRPGSAPPGGRRVRD